MEIWAKMDDPISPFPYLRLHGFEPYLTSRRRQLLCSIMQLNFYVHTAGGGRFSDRKNITLFSINVPVYTQAFDVLAFHPEHFLGVICFRELQ